MNIHEAITQLSLFMKRVLNGVRISFLKVGKPVAVSIPIVEFPASRLPGNDAGKVVIAPDFDAPLPEFEL